MDTIAPPPHRPDSMLKTVNPVTPSAPRRRQGALARLWTSGQLQTVALFLPPALILFTLFVILPLLDAGHYSLFKWSGYGEPDNFIGTRNYQLLARHSIFMQSLWNTFRIILVSLLIQLPLALALALLICRKRISNTVFRLIFFLPYILAEVATGLIWSFVFDGDYGVTSYFSRWVDAQSIYVLADRQWAFTAVLVVIVWKYFGFHMMIFIAGLQGVPRAVIEAARIDGASSWQIARHIKIPLLLPSIKISIFFAVIGSLQTFDLIVPLTNGGPSNLTHSLVSYLYTFGIVRLRVGFGSAVGIVLFIICVTYAFIYRKTVLREEAGP